MNGVNQSGTGAPNWAAVQVFGHRGSAGTQPENTLSAIEAGDAGGAAFVEFDLQLTKDLSPLLSHDEQLQSALCRLSSGKALPAPVDIRTMAVANASKYDCGWPPIKQSPPTFEEVLKWWGSDKSGVKLAVHIKEGGAGALANDPKTFAPILASLIKKYKAQKAALMMSFEAGTLQEVAKALPGAHLGYLVETDATFCDEAKAIPAEVAMPYFGLVTKEAVAYCHSLGLRVVPYTVNTQDSWTALVQAGVDGIITDFPKELRSFLDAQSKADKARDQTPATPAPSPAKDAESDPHQV